MIIFLMFISAIFGFLFAVAMVLGAVILQSCLKKRKHHDPRVFVKFYIEGKRMVKMQMKDSQTVTITAVLEDAKGVPVPGATFDAPPVWGLDDASFGSLTPSDDGLSAVFAPADKLGVCHVQFSASLGGNALVATSDDINIVPGDATQVGLSIGTPS